MHQSHVAMSNDCWRAAAKSSTCCRPEMRFRYSPAWNALPCSEHQRSAIASVSSGAASPTARTRQSSSQTGEEVSRHRTMLCASFPVMMQRETVDIAERDREAPPGEEETPGASATNPPSEQESERRRNRAGVG